MQFDAEIELLAKRLAYLKEKKKQCSSSTTSVISEEISDENPYSRLIALQKLGIVNDYKKIRDFTAVIVGIGGVGSVAADMLTRVGIGKMILIDFDIVTLANMNRLFYQPFQQGQYKVDAAKTTLLSINQDVTIETYKHNICTVEHYPEFLELLQTGSLHQTPVDVVLCCVDNFDGRLTVNRACVDLNIPMCESGVSEDAMSCHVQFIHPGFACYECMPPLVSVDSSVKPLKREGVCAASLPTTMTLVASIMVHSVLKFLLQFGEIHSYISCNAFSDYFQVFDMKPNPDCTIQQCRERNVLHQKTPKPKVKQIEEEEIRAPRENEWGIEVVGNETSSTLQLNEPVQVDSKASLESLIQQFTSL